MDKFDANAIQKALEELHKKSTIDNFYPRYHVKRDIILRHIEENIRTKAKVDGKLKALLYSHTGSGKTTELINLLHDLRPEKDFHAVLLSLSDDLGWNWSDVYFTGTLLLVVRRMLEQKQIQNEAYNKKIERLHFVLTESVATLGKERFSLQEHEGLEPTVEGTIKLLDIFIKNGISRVDITVIDDFNKKIANILNDIFDLLAPIRAFVIIQDLEQLIDQKEKIYEFLLEFNQYVKGLHCCILLVVPHHTFYWDDYYKIRNAYSARFFLPIFEVRKRDGSENKSEIDLMKDIVRRRVGEDVIDDWVVIQSALYSGGVVDKFLQILGNCCLKALGEKKPVNRESEILNKVMIELVNDYRALAGRHIIKLREISNNREKLYEITGDPEEIRKDQELKELYSLETILEYRDAKEDMWFNIHPIFSWSKDIQG